MQIDFTEAKRAVRRGQRSASRTLDTAHDATQRKLSRARASAEDMIDAGDHAYRRTNQAALSAHEWMEEKPHLAALAALAAGIILGAFLSPRR